MAVGLHSYLRFHLTGVTGVAQLADKAKSAVSGGGGGGGGGAVSPTTAGTGASCDGLTCGIYAGCGAWAMT